MTWSQEELLRIVEADDLHISPLREDGVTYGTPTWIWCVAIDGSLYVRGYNGPNSRWYQAAVRQGGSSRQELRGRSPSSQSRDRSTTASMTAIGRSTGAVRTSAP